MTAVPGADKVWMLASIAVQQPGTATQAPGGD
jgi:hypothetical protein